MARIRTIKPEFFKSEDVSTLPMRARLTWIGLWTQCDDHGRYKDSVRLIKGDLWSLDDVSLADIEEDLAVLAATNRIVRYQVGGIRYLAIVNWHAHQAINRPSKAKHPAPPIPMASADPDDPNHCTHCAVPGPGGRLAPAEQYASEPRETPNGSLTEPSVNPHGTVTEHSRQEGKGKEGKGREGNARASTAVTTPPADPGPEPPSKCHEHLNDPDPPPCGRCKDARRTHETWQQARARADALAQSQRARAQAETARLAIDACPWCDPDGRRDGYPCTHTDPALIKARTARGASAARNSIAGLARERAADVNAARQPAGSALDQLDAALAETVAPQQEKP